MDDNIVYNLFPHILLSIRWTPTHTCTRFLDIARIENITNPKPKINLNPYLTQAVTLPHAHTYSMVQKKLVTSHFTRVAYIEYLCCYMIVKHMKI